MKTLPLGDFWFTQVKWIVGPLVLVSWDWHLHFFWVQQGKPSRMQTTSSPRSKVGLGATRPPQGLWLPMGPRKYNGFGCKSTSVSLEGSRQEADALTEDFWLHPQPTVSMGLSGTCAEEDFPFCIDQVFVPLWTTQRHRNFPGISSPATNKRAWLK